MKTYDKHYQKRRYRKICPFCKSVCENFKVSNLLCNCGAKYYYFDKVWLNRKTGDKVNESEDAE